MMDYREILARRVMGWRLQTSGKWFDSVNRQVIEEFDPRSNVNQAKLLVAQLELFGFEYSVTDQYTVCFQNEFHQICESGETEAEAITNAAFELAENEPVPSEWF
ncbi:BC1872 family protein [Salisediminibacterium beveridgei]|uniref:Phage ABA sandwich domain-containing protein n=1 Tax=Salisediminibacterium beveridgei TaxID=632773 RepID=A0A1D7QVP4_9BACI|nr:hypothetical protein [Salisediminibacterium beveridgei]AOM83086.1 hypothetical protein BBEV_1725 [Salisediminibacterium beveridgei]